MEPARDERSHGTAMDRRIASIGIVLGRSINLGTDRLADRDRIESFRPRSGEREPRKWWLFRPEIKAIDHGCGKVSEAHRGANDSARRHTIRRPDHDQRDMKLGTIKAHSMPVKMLLAKVLAMVGGDDDEGVSEPPAPIEFVKQATDLTVEVSDAAVVGVSRQLDLTAIESALIKTPP